LNLYGLESIQTGLLTTPVEEWLAAAEAAPQRYYVKTHELPRGDFHPAVYLVRDGRDALVSYAWFMLQVRQNKEKGDVSAEEYRDTLARLIQSDNPHFGDWSANVRAWGARPGTVVVRFEELVQSPRDVAVVAVSRLGLGLRPLPNGEVPTFEQMQRERPKLVRRGQCGSWRDEFPDDLLSLFWKRHGDVMHQFGYGEHSVGRAA
jgi:hypothetical protein